ncbi:unnamed protein product [Dicrocoelium dendriticum]|nr:unnamed protein product [Dicrocoelium dendriticum]
MCPQAGQYLTAQYPDLEEQVSDKLERLHQIWDQLVSSVRDLSRCVGQEQKNKTLIEKLQKTISWLNQHSTDAPSTVAAPAALGDSGLSTWQKLEKRIEAELKQLLEHQAGLTEIRTNVEKFITPDQQPELLQSVDQVDSGLHQIETRLKVEKTRAEQMQEMSKIFLDLSLEAAWVREKRAQIQQLSLPLAIDLASGRPLTGQQLLQVQRLRRQLKSHQLEIENRRPRMKMLCDDCAAVCPILLSAACEFPSFCRGDAYLSWLLLSVFHLGKTRTTCFPDLYSVPLNCSAPNLHFVASLSLAALNNSLPPVSL